MLKLNASPTFFSKVDIQVPGGKSEPVKFEFKHKTKDQLNAWLKGGEDRDDVEVILDIAVGWDLAEPFTSEHVTVLVQNYIGSASAVIEKYITELTKARTGN
jgi:hypothetical protein